jgi:hypothetical protein
VHRLFSFVIYRHKERIQRKDHKTITVLVHWVTRTSQRENKSFRRSSVATQRSLRKIRYTSGHKGKLNDLCRVAAPSARTELRGSEFGTKEMQEIKPLFDFLARINQGHHIYLLLRNKWEEQSGSGFQS